MRKLPKEAEYKREVAVGPAGRVQLLLFRERACVVYAYGGILELFIFGLWRGQGSFGIRNPHNVMMRR